jgi:hypothetical protein
MTGVHFDSVMPGLVPGIHVFLFSRTKDVDGRDKPGHDGIGINPAMTTLSMRSFPSMTVRAISLVMRSSTRARRIT